MKEILSFDWNKSDNFMFVSNDEDFIHVWKLVDSVYSRATRYTSHLATLQQPTRHHTVRCSNCTLCSLLSAADSSSLLALLIELVFQYYPDVLVAYQFVSYAAAHLDVISSLQPHARRL